MNKATNNVTNKATSNVMNKANTIMSIPEEKKILDLEKTLEGTAYMGGFMVFAVIIVGILYLQNPDTFVPQFGYSLFLTVILVFIFFGIWNFYSTFKQTNPGVTVDDLIIKYGKLKSYGLFALIAAIVISLSFGIISMLGSGGDNLGLLINFIIIICLMIGSYFIFQVLIANTMNKNNTFHSVGISSFQAFGKHFHLQSGSVLSIKTFCN